jgi:hypothetical protein
MAKGNPGSEDRAKVKFRVIEFELEGGNAAVENSIRQMAGAMIGRANAPAKPQPTRSPKELGASPNAEVEEVDGAAQDPEILESETEETPETKTPKSPKTAYKPKTPNYLHNLDLTGTGTSFKEFVAAKKPKNNNHRHLVAAFWLKEHGGSETINTDKVYTCYRTADWPTNMPDWDINFRSQLPNNRFRRVTPGEYAINPKGEDEVRKMDGTE